MNGSFEPVGQRPWCWPEFQGHGNHLKITQEAGTGLGPHEIQGYDEYKIIISSEASGVGSQVCILIFISGLPIKSLSSGLSNPHHLTCILLFYFLSQHQSQLIELIKPGE